MGKWENGKRGERWGTRSRRQKVHVNGNGNGCMWSPPSSNQVHPDSLLPSPPLCSPRLFFWWEGFNARFLLAAVVAMGKPRGGENCKANASGQDQPPITFN